MRSLFAAVLLAFALSLPAHAEEPAVNVPPSEAALELARVMLPKETWEQTFAAIESAQLQMVQRMGVDDPEGAGRALAKVRSFTQRVLAYDEILKFQAQLLTKYYTPGEIAELSRFYTSPVGRKSLGLQPKIASEIMVMVQDRMMEQMPALMQELEAEFGKSKP